METHAEDDSSITTEERYENSSEEEQSSITTEPGMDESVEKRSHPQKDHGDPRRLCEQQYV